MAESGQQPKTAGSAGGQPGRPGDGHLPQADDLHSTTNPADPPVCRSGPGYPGVASAL